MRVKLQRHHFATQIFFGVLRANGILFRADIHKLFDAGYVTVTPDYHFEVSRRIKEEFENGRDYYALHGSPIRLPKKAADCPAAEALFWHNEERFLG